jgi:4-amino-4-deoxy-L-arabinose transferase-like glycosyltransferase
VEPSQASPRLRIAVVGAAVLLLLTGLGWVDASAPDEPRYLQVAEELRSMQHGPTGLVVLHLNGDVYTQKPPLYYWLAAAISAPLEIVSEGAARLPSALAGIATVWLTMVLGGRLFGGRTGVLGGALLLTVFAFAKLGRRVQLDILLTLFELAALTAFWWLDRGLTRRGWAAALLHGAMGLAVLTKGPVGFLIPVFSMVAFLAMEKRLGDLRRVFPWWSPLLSLAPGLLWIGAATALTPAGFADDALGTNLLGRFFMGTSHERPFYYFLFQFPLQFLPWTLLWPLIWIVGRRSVADGREANPETRRAWAFLLAIVGASLVFFSISSGKRGLYMVPAFPAAALLTADATLRWLSGHARLPRTASVGALAAALLTLGVGAEGILGYFGRAMFLDEGMLAEVNLDLLGAFGVALIAIALAFTAGYVLMARNRVTVGRYPALAVAMAFSLELAIFLLLLPALDPITSTRPIAVAAAAHTDPGERIGLVDDRPMVGGLAYYGRRKIAALRSADDVREFVEGGGRTLVVKRRKLERIPFPVEVVS